MRAGWPGLVFILVPVLIATVDSVVLVNEWLDPDTQKAIRLVKENSSRKENFTVQQYLYTTVYHRKATEPILIEGWRATPSAETAGPMMVEFGYVDSSGRHVSIWEANLKNGKVTPKNQEALDLAWH